MGKADVLFAQRVKERDRACRRCGSTSFLQCAHIISRSYKAIRVDPRNAVALCRSCHTRFTHRPLEWQAWVDEQMPGRWEWLRKKALGYGRVDWRAEYEALKVGSVEP